MSERASGEFVEAFRALPRAWKLLVSSLVLLGSVATAGATSWATYSEMASRAYVREQVQEQDVRAISREASVRAAVADSAAAITFAEEQHRRAQRADSSALMRRLVSLDAADREPDRRRKAEAARVARDAFSTQCAQFKVSGECGGMTLGEAADYALDAR